MFGIPMGWSKLQLHRDFVKLTTVPDRC